MAASLPVTPCPSIMSSVTNALSWQFYLFTVVGRASASNHLLVPKSCFVIDFFNKIAATADNTELSCGK